MSNVHDDFKQSTPSSLSYPLLEKDTLHTGMHGFYTCIYVVSKVWKEFLISSASYKNPASSFPVLKPLQS